MKPSSATEQGLTLEQALALLDQEQLDMLSAGASTEDCGKIAAFVLAGEYRKLNKIHEIVLEHGTEAEHAANKRADEAEARLSETAENTKPAFVAGVKWGREMYPEDRNAIIEECAKKSECADPHDGRDHAECPFCCNASEIRALKNAAPQEPVSARTGPLQGGSLLQVVSAPTGGHEPSAAALDTSRSATAAHPIADGDLAEQRDIAEKVQLQSQGATSQSDKQCGIAKDDYGREYVTNIHDAAARIRQLEVHLAREKECWEASERRAIKAEASLSARLDNEVVNGVLPVLEGWLAGYEPEDLGWISRLVDELRQYVARES